MTSKRNTMGKDYEAEAARLIAFDGTDGPAPVLNDLSRRRFINDIIEASERAEATEHTDSKRYSLKRWGISAAVALCIGVAVGVLLRGAEHHEAAPRKSAAGPSRVVAITGATMVDDTPLAADQQFKEGDESLSKPKKSKRHPQSLISVFPIVSLYRKQSLPEKAPTRILSEKESPQKQQSEISSPLPDINAVRNRGRPPKRPIEPS